MGHGLPRSLKRPTSPERTPAVIKRVFPATGETLSVDGATGVGFGTLVLGGLPEGNVMLLGAVGYFEFAGPIDAGLVDTWSGDYGVGTTPATDGTITVGDVDIIPSTAVGPAVAELSPRTRGLDATGALAGVVFDNTAGDLELNVNLLIDDLDISADGILMTVEGELQIVFVMLGDD